MPKIYPFKGCLEKNEFPMRTALRELYEESFGIFDIRSLEARLHVFYSLQVDKKLLEFCVRTRTYHVIVRGDMSQIIHDSEHNYRTNQENIKMNESIGMMFCPIVNGSIHCELNLSLQAENYKNGIDFSKVPSVDICRFYNSHTKMFMYIPVGMTMRTRVPKRRMTCSSIMRYNKWITSNKKLYPGDFIPEKRQGGPHDPMSILCRMIESANS